MRNKLESWLRSIVDSLSLPHKNTGLIVGVLQGNHRFVFGFGSAQDAHPEPPRGNTLFEIGSTTKVFTSTLLGLLVHEGRLNLEDRVCDLLPELAHFPSEITLLQLATHTSGLPKMPSNLFRAMIRNRRNPYAAYSTDDLWDYLSQYQPRKRRPVAVRYSNLGMAILGHILARRTETTYEELVTHRICDPLHLPDTRITLTADQETRLSTPHAASGKPSHNWDLPAFAGAGALRSTADDLLGFLAANVGTAPSPLKEGLQICQGVRVEGIPLESGWQRPLARLFLRGHNGNSYRQGMAIGWTVGRLRGGGRRVYWHHGATGGYRSFAGFVKDAQTGVTVLENRAPGKTDLLTNTTSADVIGFRVLEHLDPAGSDEA